MGDTSLFARMPRAHPLAKQPTWWRLDAATRRLFTGTLFTVLLLTVAAGVLWQWQTAALRAEHQAVNGALRDQAVMKRQAAEAASAAAHAPTPWWTRLQGAASDVRSPPEQLTADAMAAAPKLGVQVLRLSMSPASHSDGAPYRSTVVQAELRGPYPDIKRWLGELLARRPTTLALKSIDLRRAADGAAQPGVEASIELRLFERDAGAVVASGANP